VIYARGRRAAPLGSRTADYLAAATHLADGGTYAGGLTKFEPREMERLLVSSIETLGSDCRRFG
jgi:adenine-specific DNA-methyltransferase